MYERYCKFCGKLMEDCFDVEDRKTYWRCTCEDTKTYFRLQREQNELYSQYLSKQRELLELENSHSVLGKLRQQERELKAKINSYYLPDSQ